MSTASEAALHLELGYFPALTILLALAQSPILKINLNVYLLYFYFKLWVTIFLSDLYMLDFGLNDFIITITH